MTTPHAQQRDAAAPALPRAITTLTAQLDRPGGDWAHTITRATGPCTFGGLSEDTDGGGKRSRVEVVEDVDSVCLRAHTAGGTQALVALWIKRKSWTLDVAWRAPWPWEPHAPKQLTATELAAYIADPIPLDPREVTRRAEVLALDLGELAEHRARWEANADVWVPIPMRWSSVAPGSMFLDARGAPWTLVATSSTGGGTFVRARHGGQEYAGQPAAPTALVLVPVPERDALTLSRAVLGSRIMERESA